jgi:hypothetical protein
MRSHRNPTTQALYSTVSQFHLEWRSLREIGPEARRLLFNRVAVVIPSLFRRGRIEVDNEDTRTQYADLLDVIHAAFKEDYAGERKYMADSYGERFKTLYVTHVNDDVIRRRYATLVSPESPKD